MAVDYEKMRRVIAARLASRDRAVARGGKPVVAAPVIKRQVERAALLDAATLARQRRLAQAVNTHPPLAKLLAVLTQELPETWVVEPGLVDLDLGHVIQGLGVHELPRPARFLALEEVHQWIKRVHKARVGHVDITPYRRLFSPQFVDSLTEARVALHLH